MRMAPPAIVDRMSIDYLMWNAYVDGRLSPLAEPIRLPKRELDELASLSERFARLLERTIDLVLRDAELLSFYEFNPLLRRMIESEARRLPIALARYDAFLTPGGWRFSEFNCDVPGGVHEGAGLNDLIGGDRSRFRVVELLTDALCRETVRPTVAVCYASGYAEDLEQCQFLRREWNRVGIRRSRAIRPLREDATFQLARVLAGHNSFERSGNEESAGSDQQLLRVDLVRSRKADNRFAFVRRGIDVGDQCGNVDAAFVADRAVAVADRDNLHAELNQFLAGD